MMIKFIFSAVIVLMTFSSACSQTSPPDKDFNPPIRQTNNSARHLEKSFKLLKILAKQSFVWTGMINIGNLKTAKSDSNIWNNAELNNNENYNQTGTAIEVDIMNCAGYLVSGKLNKVGEYGWELETMPETAAADGIDKIKQCDARADGEFSSSESFAIAPQNDERKNIKIGRVDTRKVFSSLPKDIRNWLEEEKVIYKSEYGSNYRRAEKGNLTLLEDAWTDINGDGEIDLVMVTAVGSADDTEGESSSIILLKVKGKWKEVGSSQKA